MAFTTLLFRFNDLGSLDTFENDLVFGEYFHNPDRMPVRILAEVLPVNGNKFLSLNGD